MDKQVYRGASLLIKDFNSVIYQDLTFFKGFDRTKELNARRSLFSPEIITSMLLVELFNW